MASQAEKIAAYVAGLSFDDLPAEVVDKCKQVTLDTLGVMVLGCDSPWSKIIDTYYRSLGGTPEATIIGSNIRLPMIHTAFVTGTMAHSLDYDDDLYAVHVACCIIPAVLAAAEHLKASGKEIITAITIGYDLTVRLAVVLDGHHLYAMGFHPTSVCGGFGAAAAVSKLFGLSTDQIVSALGIAGSCASGGLECLSDGSMTKRFHGGKAASEGILAASLARNGYTGPRLIFEGDKGVLNMFRAKGSPDDLVQGLGDSFSILKSYIKLHACCTCNAPVIDAVLALKADAKFDWQQVHAVQVKLRNTCLPLVGRPIVPKQNPQTVLDAQMSAPYCTAVALTADNAFPEQFTPEKLSDPNIRELARKVNVEADPGLDVDGDPRPVPAEVFIKMNDGRSYEKKIVYQKGTYRNPLTSEELERKFSVCTGDKLPPEAGTQLRQAIENLEALNDIHEIIPLLTCG
jgi:2-methylcitrate dehydratase PrpD